MTTEPYGKKNPFPAPVLSVRHITGEGSPKETIHIEYSLDGSGMNYIAGDALAVIPSNDPALADALIDKLGLSPDSQVPTPEGETASLKDALVHCYDITNVNKALLTKWAAASGSQELDALLAGDKDALSDFLWGQGTCWIWPRNIPLPSNPRKLSPASEKDHAAPLFHRLQPERPSRTGSSVRGRGALHGP